MAGNEEAEEKTLPASEKKLRDGRRKGNVSQSKDFISGFTFLVIFIYLLFSWTTIRDRLLELMQLAASSTSAPFETASLQAQTLAMSVLLAISAPIAVFLVFTALLSGMVSTLGPVFAFDPVTPKMERINPAEGLKKLFSLKSVAEFGKNLFKLVVLGAALFLVMRSWLQDMFDIPACGAHCIAPILLAMLKAIGSIAAIAFIAVGFADLLMQRALFLREMRMTRTEHKREQKDLEGDPIIRSEQRRRRSMFNAANVKTGVRNAVCVVTANGRAVALRYNNEDTPVPTMVAKAREEGIASMLAQAKSHNIAIVENAELAEKLYARHSVGDAIRREFFSDVATVLVRLGFV